TDQRIELVDLTNRVMEFVRQFNIREGLVSLWSMHTTCALFINEFQTALLSDIRRFLEQMVARDAEWMHNNPEHSDCDRMNADSLGVGWLANRDRERRHGDQTFYNYNIRIEATNVCVASCLFCSFARLKPGDAGAYTMSLEEVWDKLRHRKNQPLTEVHVVNGLHPDLPFEYYTELLRGFKRISPNIHLKC